MLKTLKFKQQKCTNKQQKGTIELKMAEGNR